MTNRNYGGPAFGHGSPATGGHTGMCLRDYFAGQVVGTFMEWSLSQPPEPGDTPEIAAKRYAGVAYEIADAMLKVREESTHDRS